MLKTIRLFRREPLWIVGALWPLVILTPYLPGLPRPNVGGLPWRQEFVLSLLLTATLLALLFNRTRRSGRAVFTLNRNEKMLLLPATFSTLWSAASALWAAHPYKAIYSSLTWGAYLIFFLVMLRVVARPAILRASFWTLGIVVGVLSVSCMAGYWGAPTDAPLVMGSMFRYFSGFGETLGVVVPVFAACTLRARKSRAALLCGLTTVLGWIAILQALERAPIIGAAVGLSVVVVGMLVKRNCRPRSVARAALLTAAFAFATLLQFAPSPLSEGRVSALARLQSTSLSEPNVNVRFLYWGVALEMLRARPLTGIGANNYEVAFPEARARFAAARPASPLVGKNEEMMIQQPHNFYMQVLAETGLVGFALLCAFFFQLAIIVWRALRHTPDATLALGAGGGLVAFALSAGTSVFQFGWLAGGLLFFFAAAIVSRFAEQTSEIEATAVIVVPRFYRAAHVGALALTVLFLYGATARAMNATRQGLAAMSREPIRAELFYRAALAWDARDAETHSNYGLWLYAQGRAREAVPHLSYGVARGFNTSGAYARLAAAEAESGDLASAEKTYAYAVQVYPRSVFLRARHAAALTEVGEPQEAGKEFAVALSLDERAARGWQQLISVGADAATRAARSDPRIASPGELFPEDCARIVISESERRFGIIPRSRSLPRIAFSDN